MAMSADGKSASAAREYPRFTSAADRAEMARLRAAADAVLVGAETVRSIDPPLAVRDATLIAERRRAGKEAGPIQIVLSASGRVPPTARALTEPSARSCVLVTTDGASLPPSESALTFDVWRLGADAVDLHRLLARLSELGVARLLVEGGAETNGAFLDADLVDELHLTSAPTLLGGKDAPAVIAGAGLTMATRRRLELVDWRQAEEELFLHYLVLRP